MVGEIDLSRANPFADDELRSTLFSIVDVIDGKTQNYAEITEVISLFKQILGLESVVEMNSASAAAVADAVKNKKKKIGNQYTIYVQNGGAQILPNNLGIKFVGHIRCASYRFNDAGEYGILYKKGASATDESLTYDQATKIVCNNQKHLSLKFYADVIMDDDVCAYGDYTYAPKETYWYRPYFKLKDKTQGIHLKFPANDSIAYGKIRKIEKPQFCMGKDAQPVITIKNPAYYREQTSSYGSGINYWSFSPFEVTMRLIADRYISLSTISYTDGGDNVYHSAIWNDTFSCTSYGMSGYTAAGSVVTPRHRKVDDNLYGIIIRLQCYYSYENKGLHTIDPLNYGYGLPVALYYKITDGKIKYYIPDDNGLYQWQGCDFLKNCEVFINGEPAERIDTSKYDNQHLL